MAIVITQQQFDSRWDTLAEVLREALVSKANSDIIRKTAEAEHLPEEKASIISGLTGSVLMGFLHPEDLAEEIQDYLKINANIASAIANAINTRIFSPLRNELEKVYAPASGVEPIIVEEIKRPFDITQGKPAAPAPAGAPVSPVSIKITPAPEPKRNEGAIPVPPAVSLSNLPPKIISSSEEIVAPSTSAPKIEISKPTEPAPTGIPQPPAKSVVEPPPLKPIEEKIPVPPRPPAPPAVSQAEPFILHEETKFEPVKPIAGFKLEIPRPESKETKIGMPPRPAQIEIGGLETKPPAPPASLKPDATPRLVHYTEYRTPLGQPPTPASAPAVAPAAKVVEIKMPPAPPKPPAAKSLVESGRTSGAKPLLETLKEPGLPAPEKRE